MSNDWDKPKKEIDRLKMLRVPFEQHQISKLPKPYKKDAPKGNCRECGGYHGLPAAHLDYVGHAALTDRLLEVDPEWTWEPAALDERGFPQLDSDGGMWIKLTVCGVTRLGYGDAQGKTGGNATKERIGDALRNAAMRFGAALDLWHKGELHQEEEPAKKSTKDPIQPSDELSDEEKDIAKTVAKEVVALWEEGKEIAAYEAVYECGYSNEIFLGIWGLLRPHSAIRAGLKKMRSENSVAA